jgi:NAD(P)-dependent dehydrogenase (short-subunit alcohol dehydrogenase family)
MSEQTGKDAPAVLITGASSGIGAACALDLAARGFRVFAGVRKQVDGEKLQREAKGELEPLHVDVSESQSIEDAAAKLSELLGDTGLAGLVNNAGIVQAGPLELISAADFRRQFEVNVFGAHAVTQSVLPLLRRAKGRLVFVGSISGKITPPYWGAYAASKHALEAMADAWRMELRTWGIAVSIIEPDGVKTPIWNKFDQSVIQKGNNAELARLYDADLARVRQASAQMARTGMPASRVVNAIRHALCSRRPKPRYPVGYRTRFAHWAASNFPTSVIDYFLRRSMNLR